MLKCLLLLLCFALFNEAKTLETVIMKDSLKEENSFPSNLTVDLTERNQTMRQHCPSLNDLPVVTADRKHFYGMRIYEGLHHNIPDLSCNGDVYDKVSGYRRSAPPGYVVPMGTIFVLPGCTFYGFSKYNYQGPYKEFKGPLDNYELPHVFGNGCGDVACPASYIVDCKQHMPNCVPDDEWATVASFDNTGSSISSTFTYKKRIGVKWGQEMSEGFSVSDTVSAEMKVSFWGEFDAGVGVSTTTGYDWGHVASSAQEETHEYTVSTEVPGGKNIQYQQVTGHCGSSDVSTEMYRVLEMGDNGEWTVTTPRPTVTTPRPTNGSPYCNCYSSASILVSLTLLHSLLSPRC